MKKFLLIFMLLPFIGKSQVIVNNATANINASKELKKYKTLSIVGIVFSGSGVILSGIEALRLEQSYENDLSSFRYGGQERDKNIIENRDLLYGAIGITTIGIILKICSIHHIGKFQIMLK